MNAFVLVSVTAAATSKPRGRERWHEPIQHRKLHIPRRWESLSAALKPAYKLAGFPFF